MNITTLTELEVMEQWINALDPSLKYTLKEEFRDGTLGTHWNTLDSDEFTHEELDLYVHGIWLPSHPAVLVICPA